MFIRQWTDIPPTVDRYSADNQWSMYRLLYWPRYLPIVGQYADHHSADISVDTSVDYVNRHISVVILAECRLIYRSTFDRHSTDMSTDTSVECRSICQPIYIGQGVHKIQGFDQVEKASANHTHK